MNSSTELGNLAEALAKAQADFDDVKKDKTAKAGSYSYNYADLADILRAVRKPLSDNGLALVQATAFEDRPYLITRLIHASGEWIEGVYPLRDYDKPQEMGSALTYARRYAVSSLLGIAAEDDDGQAASKGEDRGTQKAAKPQRPAASDDVPPRPDQTSAQAPPSARPAVQSPSPKQSETPPAHRDGGAVLEEGPASPSPGVLTKRKLLSALCKGKKLDPDEKLAEFAKSIGKSPDDLLEDELTALVDELKEAS